MKLKREDNETGRGNMKKQKPETEKLAKNLNLGMKVAGWIILSVIIIFIAVCVLFTS